MRSEDHVTVTQAAASTKAKNAASVAPEIVVGPVDPVFDQQLRNHTLPRRASAERQGATGGLDSIADHVAVEGGRRRARSLIRSKSGSGPTIGMAAGRRPLARPSAPAPLGRQL